MQKLPDFVPAPGAPVGRTGSSGHVPDLTVVAAAEDRSPSRAVFVRGYF